MDTKPTPLSLRIPRDEHEEIRRMAAQDRRSVHSMLLILLDDGLAMHRAKAQASSSAKSASHEPPAVQSLDASPLVDAR